MSSQPVATEPGPPPQTGRAMGVILPHAAWVKAETELVSAVHGSGGVVALLGAPGLGKTLLLEAVERRLRAGGTPVQRLDFGDLAQGAEPGPVLLVDEADRIAEATLEELASRPEEGVAVLAALPGFAERLVGLPHRLVRLGGLRAEDVDDYVVARLAALEVPAGRMGPDAVAALGLESAGVPRLLNVLIGSSLFTAGLEKAEVVTAEHVRTAAGMHALSAVRVRVSEARPVGAGRPAAPIEAPDPVLPELELEPEPELEPAIAEAPLVADGAERPAPRASRGLLPWLAAGVVLGLVGAATAWVLLGPASGGTTQGEAEVVRMAEAREPAADARVRAPETVPAAAPEAVPAASPEAVPTPPPEVVPALPVAPPARIVLTYPRGDAAASARGDTLATLLRAAGRSVAAPFPVAPGPVAPGQAEEVLRYFFLEDRAMALAVGARAGQAPQARRLGAVPEGAPLPRPGTVEWALPASGGGRLPRDQSPAERTPADRTASERPPLAPPEPAAPAPGAVLDPKRLPLEVELRWRLPRAAPTSPCCFVEVMGLADGAWQEVFSGYATVADRHAVPLTAARGYAWRVTLVSRDGPRYAAGRWSRFTVQEAAE